MFIQFLSIYLIVEQASEVGGELVMEGIVGERSDF